LPDRMERQGEPAHSHGLSAGTCAMECTQRFAGNLL